LNEHPLKVAIVYPGDRETRRLATPENNRFAAVFAAFAARSVEAHPAVYHREEIAALREQLLGMDGALVWVNPIEAGHSRAPLDAALRERMAAVGAHSKEEYLLALVEADCAASELERTLAERWDGPFAPLAPDWKEQVRQAAGRLK